jgi:negative regulator of sigma E activity
MNELNSMKIASLTGNTSVNGAPNGLGHGSDDPVSALFDGELDDQESRRLLGRMSEAGRESDLENWARYALIGEALRGELTDASLRSGRQLDARFRAALAAEPTILAPARPTARKVDSTPFYWMAAAATVAAIAWTVISAVPEGGLHAPAMLASQEAQKLDRAQWVTMEAMPYLAAHQDYAHAVIAPHEMRYTPVSLAGEPR